MIISERPPPDLDDGPPSDPEPGERVRTLVVRYPLSFSPTDCLGPQEVVGENERRKGGSNLDIRLRVTYPATLSHPLRLLYMQTIRSLNPFFL